MDIGHNAFCLSCHATHQAYGVISICPDCKGNVLMRNSVKADALRDFLGVAPRRVTVTEEQAREILTAHQTIKSQRMEIDSYMRCVYDREQKTAKCKSELDRIMDAINGAEVTAE
jgi:hypothetical protein